MRRVNLLPSARRTALLQLIRIRIWATALILGSTALTGAFVAARVVWEDDRESLRNTLTALDETHLAISNDINDLNLQVTQKLESLRAASEIGDEPDWSILMAAIADRTGDHIILSRFGLDQASSLDNAANGSSLENTTRQSTATVTLQGRATSAGQVSRFSVRLEELNLFERVVIEDSQRDPSGQTGNTRFTIRCTLVPEDG